MNYALHILILVNIYVVLAASLNLLAGSTGLMSICAAAFFGVGAYTTALLTLELGSSWGLSVLVGMALSGALALMIGVVALRFRDDYFVMATFAFQVLLHGLMLNWVELTEGPLGIPRIPPPGVFGGLVATRVECVLLSSVFSVAALLVARRLIRSPFGRVLRSIREDEVFVLACGRNAAAFKIAAFAVGAVLSAGAGALYASYISYIDPTNFTVHESIFILAIVIIGGSGNPWGPLAGAVLLVAAPELLRFLGLPSSTAGNVQQMLYGLLLVLCMLWRPQGVVGEVAFSRGVKV